MTDRIPLIVNAGAAQIQELPAGDNISITGNITANYFNGNGSQLTGITATSIGTLPSLSVTGNTTSNILIGQYGLIGPSASSNFSRFSNSLVIVSNVPANIQQNNESINAGIVAEGVAGTLGHYGVGVYASGYTSTAEEGRGVVGVGHVANTSNASDSYGVLGFATDIHAGGNNVGLYGYASNGLNNYALRMDGGNILSGAAQTWTVFDNNSAALSVDTSGKTGILKVVTTNSAEGVAFSGFASATGNVSGGNIITAGVVSATSITLSGTGTAVNASSGNILTNKVTGTQFAFLNGSYTATLTGSGATSNYTLNLPANAGTNGQVLSSDGTGNLVWGAGGGGGSTGNIGFVGDAIYDLNGMIIENADLSHGATAAVILPSNGNTTAPVQLNNTYGNILLTAAPDPGNTVSWTFDNVGAFNVPGAGTIRAANRAAGPINLVSNNFVQLQWTSDVGNVDPNYTDAATNWAYIDSSGIHLETGVNTGNSWSWNLGTDGTTNFPNDKITQAVNTTIAVETSSGGSIGFVRTGGGSYMQTSDPIAFNAQPWSFETYFVLEDTTQNILAGVDTTPGLNIYFEDDVFVVQSESGVQNLWTNVVPTLNEWHHIAVGYNGEGINAWLDGVQLTGGQQTTAAVGGDYGTNLLYIGATPWASVTGSAMRITNMRIVAGGTTLYDPNATTITVPQPKLTIAEGTQLLLLANTSTTAYDDATGNYGITHTRTTWSEVTPIVTVGTNNWTFDTLGNLYLPNNGMIATTGNNIVITNATLFDGDITIQANNRVTVSGGDSDAPNTYGGWVYVSGGNGGPDSGVGVGGGGSVEVSGGLGANAINGGAGEGGEVRITGGAGGTANDANSIVAGNGGPVYIFGGQAGDVDNGNVALAVNGPSVEIHGGLGSFAGTNMIGRPGDVLTQGGGNGWIGASGNVYTKTSPDGYGFYTWGYINNGRTLYPIQSVQRGDTTSGTIGGYALVGGAGDQEFIISTPNGNADISDSQRIVINPGKGADGTNGEGGDIYLWAGRGGSGDEANAVSAGSGGDIKIRGGQGGGWNGDGGYIRIEAGDASSTGGASGYIDITGGNSSVSAGGRIAITGGQGVTTGGDANITGGYGSGGDGGNVNILGGSSSLGAGHFGNVIINTGNTGNIWTFDQYGNLSIPNNSYITALMGTGGAGGANISIQAGASDASYYNSNPGGNLNLVGGYGSFADGGGGHGGTVNITGGNSSDSAGGNVNITGGSGAGGNGFIFLNSDTYTPPVNRGLGTGESAAIVGTKRIVGGVTNPTYAYTSVLNGTTASVVYQASSSFAYSVKVTFVVQSNNVTWGWEQFDVVAVKNFAGGVTVTVSNRVNSNPANGDTAVTAAQNADVIEITLQQPGSGTAYINYDAVEFNLMVD